MLTIVCGEDSAGSRAFFNDLKKDYEKKNFEIYTLGPKEIEEHILRSEQTSTLFTTKLAFFTQHLNSYVAKAGKEVWATFENLSKDKDIELVDWEQDKGTRDLKIAKLGKVKEFKPQKNIFQLLDACFPSNKEKFITLLSDVSQSSDEVFIYTMLSRHIRTLILAQLGSFGARVQPWQRGKLSSQAKQWTTEKLIGFYEGLYRIDVGVKTSNNPFGVKNSLDILACYYL